MKPPREGETEVSVLAAAIEQAEDCIVITDSGGTIRYVNSAYCRLTGFSRDEAVGRNARIHKSGVHSAGFYREFWNTLASGRGWQGEMTNRRRDGALYREEMRVTPIRERNGRITHYVAIKRDVTVQRRNEESIRRELEFAQATIDALSSNVCVLDEDGRIVAVNRAWREFSRANRGPDEERSVIEMEDWEKTGEGADYLAVCAGARGPEAGEAAEFGAGIRSVLRGEREQYSTEYSCHSPAEQRWFLGRVTRFPGAGPARVLIEHINITERRSAEESLLFKTALLEGQTETTLDGILVVDESDRIVLANRQFGEVFGVPAELLRTGNDVLVREYVTGVVEEPEAFLDKVIYLYDHREERSRDEIRLRNGRIYDRYSAPLVDSRGKYRGRIWYFRDITERKAAEERSRFLALHDALTGLPHRALLLDRLNAALAGARRRNEKVALLFLDLDRFKGINDTFGHSCGDDLLRDVALRLRGCAREQDTVARLGGDEFLILLTGIEDAASAESVGRRIHDAMKAVFQIQNHSLSVGCSVGISLFPEHGTDGETLIRNADVALYSAKEAGRGKIRLFTQDMDDQTAERLTTERNLRLAIERDEFSLAYQPQIETASGEVIGFEALIRWKQPETGCIPPDRFIPIAESSGLILPIGEWVVRAACAQARKWRDAGAVEVPVAVNVSAVQFQQEGFVSMIRSALVETGLPPRLLELELTESVLLSDIDLTCSVLGELNALGVRLAIDDFGTGYSSLSYLKHFPVGKLKIDRSFVRDISSDSDDVAIIIAIIAMAKSLGVKVLAEGVENEAQALFLREHGCDQMQGYFFDRPMAPEDQALRAFLPAGRLPDVLCQ